MIGEIIEERYDIVAKLGSGAKSIVYLAKDLKLDTFWAIKHTKEGLLVESEILIKLNFPGIPRIVDIANTHKGCFLVMDYINGVSLKRKVVLEGVQKEKDILNWGIMICDILIYLHTNRIYPIVYCDLKPENIILTENKQIALVDFGSAKKLKSGKRNIDDFHGTKGYAAPEQYIDGTNLIDERTDIYSFGATLSFLIAKKVTGNIRNINPLASDGLEKIILKCMDKQPENRYQDMNKVKVDLQKLLYQLSYSIDYIMV